ncbi:hypothetical protein H634G_09723 [Metarhizium anisopliae BRIP 53293]|uniref:Uncharacterized protein n=1 Tax=Metarhizium anisopliae BRIP 53293 TaxID=1291518 RepID=A0A0D9NMX0_METAN|nr:hypothetical protein H634G_09723 [Metarhizium anisopliae BRIP 53293]KJK87579.1 hypothetical protein H633G_08572 [Metarhizium anisopliae BRIP 53284]
MYLTKLFVLVSAALGAVAQYDDFQFYNSENEAVAYAYARPNGGTPPPGYPIPEYDECTNLPDHIAGNLRSLKFESHTRHCNLYKYEGCHQHVGGYGTGPGIFNMNYWTKNTRSVKCYPKN